MAVTRGPLLYCLEAADNPECDFDNVRLDRDVPLELDREVKSPAAATGGGVRIRATARTGEPLVLIPYAQWANRDDTHMRIWL